MRQGLVSELVTAESVFILEKEIRHWRKPLPMETGLWGTGAAHCKFEITSPKLRQHIRRMEPDQIAPKSNRRDFPQAFFAPTLHSAFSEEIRRPRFEIGSHQRSFSGKHQSPRSLPSGTSPARLIHPVPYLRTMRSADPSMFPRFSSRGTRVTLKGSPSTE